MKRSPRKHRELQDTIIIDGVDCSVGWYCFWRERSTSSFAFWRRVDSVVNVTIPAGRTYRDVVEIVASHATKPIQIESLPVQLSHRVLKKDWVCRDSLFSIVDQVADQFTDMFWWISDNIGLNLTVYKSNSASKKEFDEIAGRLYIEKRKQGGYLKDSGLIEIAQELDKHFSLQKMQPRLWKKIAIHNKQSSNEIHTFKQAVLSKKFMRPVQKRISTSGQRWTREHPKTEPR